MDEWIRLLKIERECVRRNEATECDRDCANCELVQDTSALLAMYDEVIDFLDYAHN